MAFDLGRSDESLDYRTYRARSFDSGKSLHLEEALFANPVGRPTSYSVRISRAGDEVLAFGPLARRAVMQSAVRLEALGDLPADGQDGVQARQRVLEDHRDARPADVAQLFLWQSDELAAFEAHAAGDASDPLREQAQQRQGAHAFSGT